MLASIFLALIRTYKDEIQHVMTFYRASKNEES